MWNKTSVEAFKQLRIYKRLTFPLLINELACNRIMKFSSLVAAAPKIYRLSCKLIGKNFINFIIHSTYCKIFTAGNTIAEADEASQYFRKQGIPVILDYCAEGDIHSPDLQDKLDQNAYLFAASAERISQQKNEMISIKITGLLDMRVLKKWNESVELRDKFWNENKENGALTFSGLQKGLRKLFNKISQQDVKQYIRVIHKYQGDLSHLKISELEFKINHHPYYLLDSSKNNNSVIKLFFPYTQEDKPKIQSFVKRVKMICEPYVNNQNNFRILVDAQQSYVQRGIESISQQLQEAYNKQRAYILPTIQNYLKRSVQRAKFQIDICKYKKLKFGAKLVRGAYIVQQTRLANQYGYQNPVVDFFTTTTTNYLTTYQEILKNFTDGEVIVATHNIDTISSALQLKKKYPNPPTVSFAQLLGLADHLTYKLNEEKHTVYKYLPWAETEVMIPYMIRRAQQLNQMKYPLEIQYTLILDEIKNRIKG